MRATRLAMCSEFQSWGISLPRQGARQLRAKLYRFELDRWMLRTGQLLERRRSNHNGAVPVPAGSVQQRGGGLNQTLPHPRLVFLNNRTPDCFHRFVRQPILAVIEQLTGVRQIAAAIFEIHVRGTSYVVRGAWSVECGTEVCGQSHATRTTHHA